MDSPGRTGEYLGSGEGRIRGEQISGHVHWDLVEKVEETMCESNLRGLLRTDDGATPTLSPGRARTWAAQGLVSRSRVSRITPATTRPESSVSPPMVAMANGMPRASASSPAVKAPNA